MIANAFSVHVDATRGEVDPARHQAVRHRIDRYGQTVDRTLADVKPTCKHSLTRRIDMGGILLSDVVAEEVARLRRASGLNRDELAKRCAERGYPLTGATIANIETGRRDAKTGKRRREVTVDELVVLADALDTVPALLVFPLGRSAVTEWIGQGSVDTWVAVRWFGGQGDNPIVALGSTEHLERERANRLPIRLFSDYEQANRRLWHARAKVGALRSRATAGDGDAAQLLRWAEESAAEAEEAVQFIRQRMVDYGITPPEPGVPGGGS
ncbi:helix-turn-helix transcriptional regulator [Micromonospora sp. NPDC048169]|uniref:helix-turn-helix domain-containing protein n=1 Tax=Micromonospora sp. NPDC048169 TaxID=3154711 RepID=UPI0033EC7032